MAPTVPKIIACTDKNDIEGVKKCIEEHCDIDEQRQDGRSALLVACLKGYFDIVQLLVQNNANVFLKNKKGGNALGHAAYKNNSQIVQFLLDQKADPNEKDNTGRNTLHIAGSQGCNEVVNLLIESGRIENINERTNDGSDILSLCISGKCSVYTIVNLVCHGAQMTVVNKEKQNLLHQSVLQDNLLLLDFFYKHSEINLNALDINSNTCVHLAARAGSVPCLAYLLQQGAVIRSRNKEGLFPDMVAANAQNQDAADFLTLAVAPPQPPVDVTTYKTTHRGEAEVHVQFAPRNPCFPRVEVLEVQMKQNKLFDAWKNVKVLKGGSRPCSQEDTMFDLASLQLDNRGKVPQYDEATLQLIAKHGLKTRPLPSSVGVPPDSEFVLEELMSGPLVLRMRCGNKYGFGGYSGTFNVELKKKVRSKEESKEKSDDDDTTSSEDVDDQKKVEMKESDSSDSSDSEEPKKEEVKKEHSKKHRKHSKKHSRKSSKPSDSDEPANPANSPDVLQAILDNGIEELNRQVANGVDIASLRSPAGMSLIHAAVKNNRVELARFLLSQGLFDANAQTENKASLLHVACYEDLPDMLLLLLEYGADLDSRETNGMTPFLVAAARGSLHVMKLLLDRLSEDQRNAVDNSHRNALLQTVVNNRGEAFDLLLSRGFDAQSRLPPPSCWNGLFLSVAAKSASMAERLLEAGVSPVLRNENGVSPMDFAQEQGQFDILKLMGRFADLPAACSVSCEHSEKGLIVRASIPSPREGRLFQYDTAELSYKKNSFLASSSKMLLPVQGAEVCFLLNELTQGVNYQAKVRISNGNGFGAWSKTVDFALESSDSSESSESSDETPDETPKKLKKSLEKSPKSEKSPKLDIPEKSPKLDIPEKSPKSEIPEKSPKPEKPEKSPKPEPSDTTPIPAVIPAEATESQICDAVIRGDVCFIRGVSSSRVVSSRFEGLPLLHLSILNTPSKQRREMLQCLLEKGCDCKQAVDQICPALTPLLCACLSEDATAMKLLLDRGVSFGSEQVAGFPRYVFFCLLAPTANCLREIVSRGVSLRMTGDRGRGLLHLLAISGHVAHFEEVVLFLLNKGQSVDQADSDGNTPLHLAVLTENTALITYLITHGASLVRTNSQNETPVQLAERLHLSESLRALRSVSQVPLQCAAPLVHLAEGLLQIRWTSPLSRCGVPEPSLFEVEVVDLETGDRRSLGKHAGFAFTCVNPMGPKIAVRVRAKNCNGWGEWSDRGLVLQRRAGEHWEDLLFVWLANHSLEQYYDVLIQAGVDSMERLVMLTPSDVEKLRLRSVHEKQLNDVLMNLRTNKVNVKQEKEGVDKGNKDSRLSWFRK